MLHSGPVPERYRQLALVPLLVLLLLTGPPRSAVAHAIILSSTPSADQTLTGSDITVELRFNDRIDQRRSKLVVLSADSTEQPIQMMDSGSATALAGRAKGLAAGAYRLRWQVLSVDGHITRGDIPFKLVAP